MILFSENNIKNTIFEEPLGHKIWRRMFYYIVEIGYLNSFSREFQDYLKDFPIENTKMFEIAL